jgi:hydrogenase-4 component E
MTIWVEAFLVAVLLANLWLLGASRLQNCIAAAAVQGVLVGVLPLVIHIDAPVWRLGLQAAVAAGLKGVAFPLLLLRAMRSVGARREVEPSVSYPASVLVGVLLAGVSLYLGSRLPALAADRPPLLVPALLFTALTGLFVIVARKSAIMQALGYLTLETGISAFGMALAEREPLLVEMGTFLDAFVAVFVMGITIFHINREFDHIDADRLSSLKDSPQ